MCEFNICRLASVTLANAVWKGIHTKLDINTGFSNEIRCAFKVTITNGKQSRKIVGRETTQLLPINAEKTAGTREKN